ncbi:MAG TPA: 4Fe-4S binding protein, partial [Candidatus Micrarchaeota archaeon]|nr:4Fe-4S binding protein [Candidatus Micrarchaeota archaeon]
MARIAIIDRKKCTKEKCGYICMKVCPGVRMGDETVKVGEDGYPIISEVLCTGCGICPKKCPVDAIKIINLAEEIGKPVYQYGINSFRLDGIPLPQEGVVGFIGKNGIGKTTALKLLNGSLKPNFAETAQITDAEILKRLKIQER